MLELTSLPPGNTARLHFLSIQQGSGGEDNVYLCGGLDVAMEVAESDIDMNLAELNLDIVAVEQDVDILPIIEPLNITIDQADDDYGCQ